MQKPTLRLSPRTRKVLVRCFVGFAVVYFACGSLVWWAMRQPPETFGRVMARMPGPVVFLAFPFETFWLRARSGHLQVGDAAPDFSLFRLDKTSSIRLSELNRNQPVVLVFGSYT